jgi:hypothetical protein
MRVVVTATALTAYGGSESYAVTVADHLQRLGHDVWLTAPELGAAAESAAALGLRVVTPGGLPAEADAILSQDGAVAYELAASHPGVPQVFVAHSDIFDLSLPPALPGIAHTVVTLYDRVDRRVRALATDHRVTRLTQPVDVERFKPTRPLPATPRVALALGNYVHGQRADLLRRACDRAGVELRHLGGYGPEGQTRSPEAALNDADIVFGKARVVAEAMACGRAAYVYDHNGGEGWVTNANRARLAADNFGGQSAPIAIDEDRLVADLARYDPDSGLANRDYVVGHHAASKHAAALVELLREASTAPVARPDAPLAEMGRLIRLHHRADAQSFALHADASRLAERLAAAEAELAWARSRAAAEGERADAERRRAEEERRRADAERTRASERAAEVDRLRGAYAALAGTRRWQAVQRLMGPLDRLRLRASRDRGARR